MYVKKCNLRTLSREYDCLANIGSKKAFTFWKTRSNVKGQHAPTRNNQRQKYMKKTHLLMRIVTVIGRYGLHLMIVMIFVTQNNFENGPGISNRLLGFYRPFL